MNMGSAKRIQRDLEELNNCWSGGDIAGVRLVSTKISADETPQQQYQVALVGPSNSPYAGGRFLLDAAFPLDYPFKPPHLRFVTPIYHANINEQGSIDLQALKDGWSPQRTLKSVIVELIAQLQQPNADNPLRPEAAKLFKENRALYDQTAAECTRKFAMAPATQQQPAAASSTFD